MLPAMPFLEPWDDTALHRAVDEARADEAVRARSRERWLRQQAHEAAEFNGTLLDLLERGAGVAVQTASGALYRGRLVGLARDVCSIRTEAGRRVWIRLAAVTAVRPHGGIRHPADDERTEREDVEFAEVLARLAEDRPRVQLVTAGASGSVSGELQAVGADVVTMLEGGGRDPCYVSLPSVLAVSVLDSG
ncbi:MAG: hypothetical protein GEU81_16350 [Nitriliruptorales bacterium]|nr:hypothetical protein [Nitriliruptorales bacterium]